MWRTQARLVVSVVLAKVRPAQRVLDSTSSRFVVKPWQVDLNFHLNHAMYVNYFARAQGEHFMHTQYIGLLYLHGWSNFIATTHINYVRAVRSLTRVSIETHIAGCDEKYVYCEQSMNVGPTLAATATQRMVIVDRQGNKIAPRDAFAAILEDTPLPPCPPYRDALRNMAAAQRAGHAAGGRSANLADDLADGAVH